MIVLRRRQVSLAFKQYFILIFRYIYNNGLSSFA
jgi:hypothetical protein